MRRLGITGWLVLVLHAMAVALVALYISMPANKYSWMRDYTAASAQLPVDPESQMRSGILFVAAVAPALLALLWGRSALPGGLYRASCWLAGLVIVSAVTKLLANVT